MRYKADTHAHKHRATTTVDIMLKRANYKMFLLFSFAHNEVTSFG